MVVNAIAPKQSVCVILLILQTLLTLCCFAVGSSVICTFHELCRWLATYHKLLCVLGRGHTILMSRELMWCYACSWDVRGELTLNSMTQIHTSVTLLTSRDLTWSSGRLTRQHASNISVVAHISWGVTNVLSALHSVHSVLNRLSHPNCTRNITWAHVTWG